MTFFWSSLMTQLKYSIHQRRSGLLPVLCTHFSFKSSAVQCAFVPDSRKWAFKLPAELRFPTELPPWKVLLSQTTWLCSNRLQGHVYKREVCRYLFWGVFAQPTLGWEARNSVLRGFPDGAVVKNLPANAGDTGSSPGPGRSHMPWSN